MGLGIHPYFPDLRPEPFPIFLWKLIFLFRFSFSLFYGILAEPGLETLDCYQNCYIEERKRRRRGGEDNGM